MREIFRPQVEEFHYQAALDLFYTGEDGSGPSPIKGDRWWVLETSAQDPQNLLVMWSARMEEYFAWNEGGWWEKCDPIISETITLLIAEHQRSRR